MVRTPPSPADAEIITAVQQAGHRLSVSQLERWRRDGLMPRNMRQRLGRGRGTHSTVAPGAIERAVFLASQARQGRQIPWTGLLDRIIAFDVRPEPGAVKQIILAELDRLTKRFAADADDPHSDEAGDERFNAAKRAVAGTRPTSVQWLIDALLDRTDELPEPAPVSRNAVATLMQVLAGGINDMSGPDIYSAAEALHHMPTGDPDLDVFWEGLRDGSIQPETLREAMESWTLPGMRARVAGADEQELIEALRACVDAQTAQSELFVTAIAVLYQYDGDDTSPEVQRAQHAIQQISCDPTWLAWGRYNHYITDRRGLRNRQLAIAATQTYLADNQDELRSFAGRASTLLMQAALPSLEELPDLFAAAERLRTGSA